MAYASILNTLGSYERQFGAATFSVRGSAKVRQHDSIAFDMVLAEVRIDERMFGKNHPYHWPVIGYMDDLTAASAEDVREFFRKYYAPQNASLVVAGDINAAEARKRIEYWFADVKSSKQPDPIEVPPAGLSGVITETLTDQCKLPRLSLV
jgi:zinc protease